MCPTVACEALGARAPGKPAPYNDGHVPLTRAPMAMVHMKSVAGGTSLLEASIGPATCWEAMGEAGMTISAELSKQSRKGIDCGCAEQTCVSIHGSNLRPNSMGAGQYDNHALFGSET